MSDEKTYTIADVQQIAEVIAANASVQCSECAHIFRGEPGVWTSRIGAGPTLSTYCPECGEEGNTVHFTLTAGLAALLETP